MAEPTAGPWRACTDPNDQPQLLYRGLIAPIFYSPDGYVAVVSDTRDVGGLEECQANAYLMAAAPAMREALRDIGERVHSAQHDLTNGKTFYVNRALAEIAELIRVALTATEPPAGRGAGVATTTPEED